MQSNAALSVDVERGLAPLRLHIGGEEVKPGWRIVNVQDGPDVDFLGDVTTIAQQFEAESVDEIYASHILEHPGYDKALPETQKEFARILKPGGKIYIAVPDLAALSKLFGHPNADLNARIHIMRIMFRGRTDPYDVHCVGSDQDILGFFLGQVGFKKMDRVKTLGLFDDASTVMIGGLPVSLNVIVTK
jgi:predicted SAM-dependent methyltransferase